MANNGCSLFSVQLCIRIDGLKKATETIRTNGLHAIRTLDFQIRSMSIIVAT
jgi:hypothetical protein